MVSVVLGTKIADFSFHVSDLDMDALKGNNPDYTISKDGDIIISESNSDYVVLSGSFNWTKIMSGDYDAGIKQLTGMTVYEDGKLTYKATGLGITGSQVESGALFQDYLADQGYSIKGNNFGNDLESAEKNDVLRGLGGNDTINGLAGIDRLFGDDGIDRISGGVGNDFLTGGVGADVFVFVSGDGDDTILDFRARGKGQDQIDLSGHADVASFDDLDVRDAGKNVVITVGEDTITLKNVADGDVGASDFIF